LEEFIGSFQTVVDRKYSTIVCKLAKTLTHPKREIETTLGNLMADAFAENAQCDVMLLGSGSVRVQTLGPIVTLKDFIACFPYDDTLTRFTVSGAKLRSMFAHFMRIENRDGEGECYQVNTGVQAMYSESKKKLLSLRIRGEEVVGDRLYTICLQGYHASNSTAYLDITPEELLAAGPSKVVTTSAQEVLEEYLRTHQNASREVEGRLVYQ
jgi:5'-nucleotidase